jgi:cell division septation protein DedD
VADLVLILIGVSLLISPVPHTIMQRGITPLPSTPSVLPEVVSSPEHMEVDGASAGTPPETAAPPAPDPISTRQSKTPTAVPSYFVRIGPISESNAVEIARRLGVAHYSVRNRDGQTEPQRFRVVSDPIPRKDAHQLASTLAQRNFPSFVRSLKDDQVELQLGVFTIRGNADELAGRIRHEGYSPAVVHERAVPIIGGGPYSAASVTAIIKTVESAMSDYPLTSVPCGAKDPLIHAWRGWVEVCRRPPSDR